MRWSALAEKVHQHLIRSALVRQDDRLLLAVSGGLDSVVLLHVFLELQPAWKWDLLVGHIDHGLRPGADDDESRFCEALAKQHGLTYLEEKLVLNDPGEKREYENESTQNPSTESLARNARYRIFTRWAREYSCDAVVTAHHANDQAETLLYRMLTGAGLNGLSGIPAVRGVFRRPLIRVLRSELAAYAEEKNIAFYEDSSNEDTAFARNKIRHEVVPALKKMGYNDLERMLARSAAALDEASAAIGFAAREQMEKLLVTEGPVLKLRIPAFNLLPAMIRKEIIRILYREKLNSIRHVSGEQLEEVLDLIARGECGKKTAYSNHTLTIGREFVQWEKEQCQKIYREAVCADKILIRFPGGEMKIELAPIPASLVPDDAHTAYFSEEILNKAVIVRSWEPADRMTLFGKGGRKKVSDILKDEKVSAPDKKDFPVLETEGQIIWIPGVKRSGLFVVKKKDSRLVSINYNDGSTHD